MNTSKLNLPILLASENHREEPPRGGTVSHRAFPRRGAPCIGRSGQAAAILAFALLMLLFSPNAHGQNAAAEPKPAAEVGAAETKIDASLAPAPTTATEAKKDSPARSAYPDGKLRLNFRGVPLEMVLDYLSEAAGFIIVKETEVKGKVDVWSNQPVTTEEAIELLDQILNKNEYAAIRNGRTLTIVSRDEAKKRRIPVKQGGDAKEIPNTEQMVTQVIPVSHAAVTPLLNNLRPLIGTYAEITVNESANSLIVTATEADIKRLAEIINALDDSISSTSSLKVFPLKYADAKELATVIRDLFAPTQQQQGTTGNRGQLGGLLGGAFPGGALNAGGGNFGGAAAAGGRGGAGGTGGRGGSGSSPLNVRVVAVADERSNSVIVAAPGDMMTSIEKVIEELNQPVDDITELRVFWLKNSNPVEVANLLASLFPDDTRSSTSNANQPQFQFNRGGFGGGFGGGGGGRGGNAAASASQRLKKQGRVLAVPDERTGSLVVSAASELMPQISDMIAQMDASQARKQKVFVYSLENADPQQVQQILQDMFQRTTTSSRNNANQSSALSTRIQSNNQAISTGQGNSTGFGNTGSGGGFGGGTGQQLR